MKTILSFVFIIGVSLFTRATDHTAFYKSVDSFLKTHVKDGLINYNAISKNQAELDALIEIIASSTTDISNPKDYQSFYINAYNIYVIKGIVDDNLSSPLDKKGFFDTIKRNVAGEKITLNDIENKKLRAQFKDARVHFVLVCGALGCPPIIDKAYRPEMLEKQLEQQTSMALNNDDFIQIKKNKVAVSQIFEWYEVDFTTNGQSVLDYIAKYRKVPLPEKAKLSFYNYNWKVNKQ